MIQPPPHKLRCKKCNYSKTVQPKSDALDGSDFVATCPKCGGDMEYEEIKNSTSLLGRIFGI